jgi:nitrous oxide reductase accessory protein NosL
VTVTLTGTDDRGNAVSLTTTTATLAGQAGSYLFAGLRPSNPAGYTVTETGVGVPATFVDGKDSAPGSLGGTQANPYADRVTAIPVSAGASGVNYNFGEVRAAQVAGVVFDNTAENDGVFHPTTDPGLNGVTVTLTGTDDLGNAVSLTTTTATIAGQTGSYVFAGLRPSSAAGYTVTETGAGVPATFLDGKDSAPGSLGGSQTGQYADQVTAIPVSAGASGTAYDFGDIRPAQVAGVVFDNTAENDGVFHAATDPGLNGVTVTLSGTDDRGNAVSLSTTTTTIGGQAGSYVFAGLRPSNAAGYTVTETGTGVPATFVDGRDSVPGSLGGTQANPYADRVTAIPVAAGASGANYNFGEIRPAQVAGVVFDNTVENDGVFRATTDAGLNGVTLTLTGTDDLGNAVSLTTTTATVAGQAGSYLFTGLRPSSAAGYTVTETGTGVPATFVDGKDSVPGSLGGSQANLYADRVTAIPVAAGASGVNYNFGEIRAAQVAGVVFDNTAENDGVFHAATDPGINGVTVTLTGTDDQGNAVSLTTTTATLAGQAGSYLFAGLRPSNAAGYTITETGAGVPAAFVDGKDSVPGSLGGSQAGPYADRVTAIPVSAGASGVNYNFGEIRAAQVAGVVFDNTAENDGVFHAATDAGLNGVTVTLTGTDDRGNAVSLSTTTATLAGQAGSYLFAGLRPSSAAGYTVTETGTGVPATFLDGKDSAPGSLGGSQAGPYADRVTAIPVSAGASGVNYNFGEIRAAQVAGVVFDNTAENDGVFHAATDAGLNGVTVTLTGTDDQGSAVSLSTTTTTIAGQAGSYVFASLRPSSAAGYTVTETGVGVPATFVDGKDSVPGSLGGTQANPYADQVTAIPVPAGASGANYDFSELHLAQVAGVVFDNTAENDGVLHPATDPGLNGVIVTLTGTDDQGNAVSLTTTTATLAGLRPSDAAGYTVTETGTGVPATFLDGKDSVPGSLGGSQAGPYADRVTAIPVAAGASGVHYDFGEIRPAQVAGVVFDNTAENDGVLHPATDPGLNGVTVTLTGTDDRGNAVSLTTTTATLNGQAGSYLFTGLRPSNAAGYTVTETGAGLPAGFLDGKDSAPGSLGGSQAGPYADQVTAIPVAAGAVAVNYNFGEIRPARGAGAAPAGAQMDPSFVSKVQLLGSNTNSLMADNIAYVNALYHQLFGRSPDQREVNTWVFELDAGVSRAQVADGIRRSAEHAGRQAHANRHGRHRNSRKGHAARQKKTHRSTTP